jgi:hypothetical protein
MEGFDPGHNRHIVEAIGWPQPARLRGVRLVVEASKIGDRLTHSRGH